MKVIDKILLEWSFRCHDGIVDLNDPIKLSILNEILGFDLDEAKSGLEKWKKYFADSEVETVIKKDAPIFDEKGKKTGDTIKAGETITTQVVPEYQPKIPVLYNGNIIYISIDNIDKGLGKASTEYYDFKPQDLGITSNQDISIDQLKQETTTGINANQQISDVQKKFLLQLVNDTVDLTPEEKQEILSERNFLNQVIKNLGEIYGAIMYSQQISAPTIYYPSAGNYPLIDYILKKGDEVISVSAKAASGKGNVVKLGDIKKLVGDNNIDSDKKFIIDTISSESARTGPLKLIDKFGDDKLKQDYQDFLQDSPEFPKTGFNVNERLRLEREIIKQINAKINFSDIFNKFVNVIYVKYGIDTDLQPFIRTVQSGTFKVELRSKNSPNHEERIGFDVMQAK
jgi:hypothetical protein